MVAQETFFAPAERSTDQVLAEEFTIISDSPVMSGLLQSVSGLLAILDENRQIVALNDSFLQVLGIDDPKEALGLRPGEALDCIHAHEHPHGCGTTKFCSSCGAAVAIVTSLGQNEPVERLCALSANDGKRTQDIALLVKSQPIDIGDKRFLLLFVQDVSQQQQQAALERTFFHDVNNMLAMLVGASDILIEEQPSELAGAIHQASFRLLKEVSMQRCLSQFRAGDYQPSLQQVKPESIVNELQAFFANHPVARGKTIEFPAKYPPVSIETDPSLLLRVLCNMTLNALEATPKGETVKVWFETLRHQISFCVWNAQAIPPDTASRIFQRNFTTKEQAGRGVGTYSMKLFGEKILGGEVSFTTSEEEGTVFRFATPV